MKKLLIYMKKVYQIPAKVRDLSDGRKRRSIPAFNIIMPVLVSLILQYESFHTVFTAPESMGKRLKHLIKGRVAKVDAVRDVLTRRLPEEVEEIHIVDESHHARSTLSKEMLQNFNP